MLPRGLAMLPRRGRAMLRWCWGAGWRGSAYSGAVADRLVWIDCEMTGLDLGKDALIEIAALVTDADLTVLGDGVDIVIHADEEKLDGMPEVVREMHAHSGLTDEVRRSAVSLEEAEQR